MPFALFSLFTKKITLNLTNQVHDTYFGQFSVTNPCEFAPWVTLLLSSKVHVSLICTNSTKMYIIYIFFQKLVRLENLSILLLYDPPSLILGVELNFCWLEINGKEKSDSWKGVYMGKGRKI